MGDLQLHQSEVAHVPEDMSASKLPTPLPRWELFLIWIIHASQAFQTTMLFPMLVFMIEYFGVGSRSTHTAGQYAGILASLFPLAQFCTSLLWGSISDSTGRKPWLAFGNVVSAVSAILLGMSQRYTTACAVRFVGGLLNGTMTITKSVLGEICDGSNKAKGFGILNLAWGVGSVAGPVLSGFLAQPCSQYKLESCPRLLESHPFLLPCLVAAMFSTAALFASLAIRETLPRRSLYVMVPSSVKELQLSPNGTKLQQDGRHCVLDICAAKVHPAPMDGKPDDSTKSMWLLLRDRNVLLTSLCYSLTGLIFITTDELFPIFGAASRKVGGLGLSSSSLGLILGEGGVVLFLFTLLLYPIVAQRLGPLKCFRLGLVCSVPLWLVFPTTSLEIIARAPAVQWTLLSLAVAARNMIACTTFTGVLVLVSNSASAGNMGAVTGLSHSLCSFFRAVGPAFGGTIWSYAARQTFPFHQSVAWLAISCISLFTFCMSTLLPASLTFPKS